MRDVVIFSSSDLIRFALRAIIEPVIIHQPDRVSAVLKVCTSLPEFEREILTSVNPVVVFDIDNVPIINQYSILEKIKGKINEINLVLYSKESKLSNNYPHFKGVDVMYLCKTATLMEIESTIFQCFHRLVTSWNKVPNIFMSHENKSLKLTGRESEILSLLMFGMDTKDIAGLLSINVKTISSHKINILKKYEATSLVELYNKWRKFPF
ncbi:helix-turn-helix domain-containing protein [Yersinia enterocolitica]|uniref:helix-turn-helix domain-containing protein n=1 Tax=Yersinia enterocolitica TaxID=630 RepID=UPI00398D489C